MTEKEFRRLSRKELLEILIDQTKEINSLRETVKNLESELNARKIMIMESGSMAEASLKLNGLFADADIAAQQYLANAQINEEESRRILEEARKKTDEMIADAEKIRSAKIREANQFMDTVKTAVRDYLLNHPEMSSVTNEEE